MRYFLALAFTGAFCFILQAQSDVSLLDQRIASDVQNLENLVMGDIPALALTPEQKEEVASIYRDMYEGLEHLDPYKDGKREVSIAYRDGHELALKESLSILTAAQRLSYTRQQQKKASRR